MENQYWSLAQVVAWAALRQDEVVARVGEAKDKSEQLRLEAAQVGLLSPFDGYDIDYFDMLRCCGDIIVRGRKSAGAPLEVIPKEHWTLMYLRGANLNDNRPRKKTRQDFLEGRAAMDGGLDRLTAEVRTKISVELDELAEETASLPDWRDLAFDPIEIKTAFEPCREHEVFWTLRETIGFVGLGYPLSVMFGYEAEGQKKLAAVKKKLRLALQSGKLTAYGRPCDTMQNRLKLQYQKLEADTFIADAHQFKVSEIHGTIELPYRILDVRFRSEDVRALFQPVEAVATIDYRNGAPGRPTSRQLVEGELRRRASAGELVDTLAGESRFLSNWLSTAHPAAPPMEAKTVENQFRNLYRQLTSQTEAA